MSYSQFHWYDHEQNKVDYDEYSIEEPRQCMHCLQTGTQINLGCYRTTGGHDNWHGVGLYACQLCGSTTIHYLINCGDDPFENRYKPFASIPTYKGNITELSSEIKSEFPDFYTIYHQSKKAEENELGQIAGMGYRKAIEFLVTDYLLQYPVDGVEDKWLKNPKITLSSKISKIPSERIRNLAKAITYLGNDESHYTKQHPEYDLNAMKAFIKALVAEIHNEIEYREAEKLLNKPKP